MAASGSRFVIVPQQSRSPWRIAAWGALWLASLLFSAWLSIRFAAPHLSETRQELGELRARLETADEALEEALQKNAVLARSEQIGRDALNQLQSMLTEQEEEIAGLRADVVFYERLVGGSAQRKGLTIHSAEFRARAPGDLNFSITLTQNLKKSGMTRGTVSFALEGVSNGSLRTLSWDELRQQEKAAAANFEFRYFQKVEGSVILPAGFTPHRVRVRVERDGAVIDRVIPWEDTQKSEGD